jgi:hypothetical protein
VSKPYLITDGADLAYLASQVNIGVTYAGRYFQVTNDINLGGREWIPIGTNARPFMGIFDGAGHVISNAVIRTKPANTDGVESYGLFGSITGTAGNVAEIRNVEISNFTIRLGTITTATTFNANSGYHVGFIVGTVNRNSKVSNNIVKASSIMTTR